MIRNFINWLKRSGKPLGPHTTSFMDGISFELENETGIWRTGLPALRALFLARWHHDPSDEFWMSGLAVSFLLPENHGAFDYLESEAMLGGADD